MVKKIVLLSLRDELNQHRTKVDILEEGYISYFEKKGYLVIPVSNRSKKVKEYFTLDPQLVVLTGGAFAEDRSNVERVLMEGAIKKKIPIFGVCHGLQFINHFYGGKRKKILGHVPPKRFHDVSISLGKLNGEYKVNSYHNWGVTSKELARSLEGFAIAKDGIIEGVKHSEDKVIAIQWHPERDGGDEISDGIFKYLLEEI